MPDKIVKQFETYQPSLIQPNNIIAPACFNNFCLVRRYRVTAELIDESDDVLKQRLELLLKEKPVGSSDGRRILQEARDIGIELDQPSRKRMSW